VDLAHWCQSRMDEGGFLPPHSVLATGSALGSVPTVALSSARFRDVVEVRLQVSTAVASPGWSRSTTAASVHRGDIMKDSLHTALKKLRLSGMLETLDVRLHEATSHRLGYDEFLELILEDELLVRNERLIKRRVKAAGFRELKTLDDVDWSFNPSI